MEEFNVEQMTEDINKILDLLWTSAETDKWIRLEPDQARVLVVYINLLTTAFELVNKNE